MRSEVARVAREPRERVITVHLAAPLAERDREKLSGSPFMTVAPGKPGG
jgi:hypothetical protein